MDVNHADQKSCAPTYLVKKISQLQVKKAYTISNKCNPCSGLVNLPDVELLVFLNTRLNLIRLVSLVGTLLHNICHPYGSALPRHLPDQIVDLVVHITDPERKKCLTLKIILCNIVTRSPWLHVSDSMSPCSSRLGEWPRWYHPFPPYSTGVAWQEQSKVAE